MRLLIIAITCLSLNVSMAQKGNAADVISDNGAEINEDGTNNFKTPIGLDLMGGNTKGLTIYPNQDGDYMLISVAGKSSEKRHITMTSITGKPVYRLSNRRENTFMIDTSGLGKGIYVIEVASGNKVYRKKWAKS